MRDLNPSDIITFIRQLYPDYGETVPLHAPVFQGNEQRYLLDCLASTFVSSVGPYVNRLEQMICEITGAGYAVATNCGTAALHAALLTLGVQAGDEVLTQPLSFVATANAIAYCQAHPVFVDVAMDTLGLCPEVLADFLATQTEQSSGACRNRTTGRRIAACVPMHTFGHPAAMERLAGLCRQYHIPLLEDAAEALGSTYKGKHCGTFGQAGIISFNGNKIVTSGGGGVIVTDDKDFAGQARHLTTTAKKPHPYLYEHTEVGYNYRMPNLNAALCCGQLEQLELFLTKKRAIAESYRHFFQDSRYVFISEPGEAQSNYWLNGIMTGGMHERDQLLAATNAAGVITRPVWTPLHRLPMFAHCQVHADSNAVFFAERIVNLPSSVAL